MTATLVGTMSGKSTTPRRSVRRRNASLRSSAACTPTASSNPIVSRAYPTPCGTLGQKRQQVVGGAAEADRQEAVGLQARHHHVVPRLPLLDSLVREVRRIVEHRFEDRREVDRHRVAVRQVVLFLEEELQELERLVRILRLR